MASAQKLVVLVCCFMSMFLGSSLFGSSSIIHSVLLHKFEEPETTIAMASSLFVGFFCYGCPIASIFINKISCRTTIIIGSLLSLIGFGCSAFSPNVQLLYFTYGITAGCGQAFVYAGCYVAMGFYFDKQRSLAIGVILTGFSLGLSALPVICRILFTVYNTEGAFLLLGAISFQVCVFGMLVRPHKLELEFHEMYKNQMAGTTFCDFRVVIQNLQNVAANLSNIPFLVFLLSILGWSQCQAIVTVHLSQICITNGISPDMAAWVVSLMGIGNIISRLLVGMAAIDGGINRMLLYWSTNALAGLVMLFCYFYLHFLNGSMALAFFYGLYSGGTWTLLGPLTVELVGIKNFATCFGLEMLFAGIGMSLGPYVAGLMHRNAKQYSAVLIYSSCMQVITFSLGILMNVLHVKEIQTKGNKPSKHEEALEEKEKESMLSGRHSVMQEADEEQEIDFHS